MGEATKSEKALRAFSGNDRRCETTIVQLNLGAVCNQRCRHCHVNAGPQRTERMEVSVVDRVFDLVAKTPSVRTLDLTGGAPELYPFFRSVVKRASALGLGLPASPGDA